MNEILNKFLLIGDKFTFEIHLRQSGYTYSASGPFTKKKEKRKKGIIQNLKKQEIHDIFIKTN